MITLKLGLRTFIVMKKYLLAFSILSLIVACTKTEQEPEQVRFYDEYFTDSVKYYIDYSCDSLVYNDFSGTVDTFTFDIREYYESSFIDNAGRKAIRLERWKKTADTTWFLKDVWQVTKTKLQVEKTEEDVRFFKLKFPLGDNYVWNMNLFNSLPTLNIRYINMHASYNNGLLDFDSTITVRNTDPENLVSEFRTTEVYAINKGLVFKNLVDVKLKTDNLSLPWQQRIRSGVIFTMRAKEFGFLP